MNTGFDFGKTTDVFWGEISPCEHLVQIYENDGAFMDTLEEFIGGGLRAGDGVIVIATAPHLNTLEQRLEARGMDVDAARSEDQYIPLAADEVLAGFMVGGWPDDALFTNVVSELIARARRRGRRVRAFGEMVAILWARGDQGATVRLEHLWHRLCQTEAFSLFCAYPKVGFTRNASESISELCAAHSKVIPG
ncbi:MAG: MEDS domain-containing protein [Candidatus Binatia bacterium]